MVWIADSVSGCTMVMFTSWLLSTETGLASIYRDKSMSLHLNFLLILPDYRTVQQCPWH